MNRLSISLVGIYSFVVSNKTRYKIRTVWVHHWLEYAVLWCPIKHVTKFELFEYITGWNIYFSGVRYRLASPNSNCLTISLVEIFSFLVCNKTRYKIWTVWVYRWLEYTVLWCPINHVTKFEPFEYIAGWNIQLWGVQ